MSQPDPTETPGASEIARDHMALCHPDGSECPDGCDVAADPRALESYRAEARTVSADALARVTERLESLEAVARELAEALEKCADELAGTSEYSEVMGQHTDARDQKRLETEARTALARYREVGS